MIRRARNAARLLPALLALAGAPGAAAVEATALRVRYSAPAGCPGEEAFLDEVLARTPRARKAGPGEAALELAVDLQATPSGATGRLSRPAGSEAPREVSGRTCGEVAAALALTAALLVDPDALIGTSATTGTGAEDRPARWTLGAGLELLEGALPDSLWGPAVQLELALGEAAPGDWLAPRLRARASHRRQWSDPSVRVASAVSAVALDLCPVVLGLGAHVALRPCGGLEAGLLAAEGRRLDRPLDARSPWLAALGALRLEVAPRRGLGLELEGGLVVPLARPRFFVDMPRTLEAEVGGLAVAAAARLGYRFP